MGTSASMSYPFYQLSTSGFWNLVEQTGRPHRTGRTISSVKKLKEFYVGARFNEDLYPLLVMETSREKLRKAMIQTYVSPQTHHALNEQAIINRSAANYEATLLNTAERHITYQPIHESRPETQKKIRDQGFRKAIVKLNEHRCALCGIRMLTPEGHTIVEAAHIVPWQ